jgi:hypothetical protein
MTTIWLWLSLGGRIERQVEADDVAADVGGPELHVLAGGSRSRSSIRFDRRLAGEDRARAGSWKSTISSLRSEGGKNWRFSRCMPRTASAKGGAVRAMVIQRPRIASRRKALVGQEARPGLVRGARGRRLQDRRQDGREEDRHEPRGDQRDGDHLEERDGVFARLAFGEADRHEAGDGDERAVSIGAASRLVGKACRLGDRVALAASRRRIASTVVMASSTRRASAMMSAPSDTRCRSIPIVCITRNTTDSVTGMAMATTAPGRTPSIRKLTTRMIRWPGRARW